MTQKREINVESLEDLINEILYAIRDLKDNQRKNSGRDWLREIFKTEQFKKLKFK